MNLGPTDIIQKSNWKLSNGIAGHSSKQSDEDVLRECLERTAPDLFGGTSAIAEIRRSRFELSTSYDAYRVIVRMVGGEEIKLFLKDFAFSLRNKNDPKQRREREVGVYRDLLAHAGLNTARYYGSVMDEASGRLWLLVEYVEGTPVGYCDLGGCWAPAAEALGRMHGYFAGQVNRLRDCDFLISHQAEFFSSAAEHALSDVGQVAPHLVERLENLVRRYAPLVKLMTSQSPTLVHGGCRPSNILVRVVSEPGRVCILDWEEAAFGAPLFDLAHLVDGIKPPLVDRLVEAYRHGATDYGMSLPAHEEIRYVLDCFRLHMAFNSLSRAVFKRYKEADIAKLIDYGERIGSALFGPDALPLSLCRQSEKPVAGSGKTQPMSDDEDQIKLTLEGFLSKRQRRAVKITGLRRKPSPVAGVFPADVLRVYLEGGEKVTLFVKHLGPEQAEHPDKQCRDREPRIYEDLLGRDSLHVPQYYGSRWNEVTRRRELYLEYIGDWSLKYQELDHWFAAAPKLARLHAHFAMRAAELQARDYLLCLDTAYFHRWAERASAVVAEEDPGLAAGLAEVQAGYSRVAEILTQQPVTLVHNDLAPKNVIADRSQDPARICFVDWEMAGVGCGLLDLVHLKHGLDPASDQKICTAYCAELGGTGLLPSSPSELRRLFAACELHHTLYRLAHSKAWGLARERVAQWVADAQNLTGQI
jgi:aminoglycoside phosphotransferase (APT) family kinase protein